MNPLVGQIDLFPYTFTPKGWAPCQGQLLAINQNQVLFSLLGTTFGGDGRQSFALPNLKGKEPAPNLQYYIALEGVYPSHT